MFAKLVDNNLVIAGNVIKGQDETGYYSITNPSKQQLIDKGYKLVVYGTTPEYDFKTEKIVEQITEQPDNISITYNKVPLTDEEHYEVIEKLLFEKEKEYSMSRWQHEYIVANKTMFPEFVVIRAQELEDLAAELRKVLNK